MENNKLFLNSFRTVVLNLNSESFLNWFCIIANTLAILFLQSNTFKSLGGPRQPVEKRPDCNKIYYFFSNSPLNTDTK